MNTPHQSVRRPGMAALQVVLLLGAGFLIVFRLMELWNEVSEPVGGSTKKILNGEIAQANPGGGPAAGGGKEAGSGRGGGRIAGGSGGLLGGPGAVIRRRTLPTRTIPGVTVQADGRVVSTPVTANADGEGNFVTNEEQSRGVNAIEVAVATSPSGIAIILGDHGGGPSNLDLGAIFRGRLGGDHVAVAYRDGDRVVILERIPDELRNSIIRNIGLPGPGPRELETFVRGYDTIHALPVAGLTREQADRFIREMTAVSRSGETYGFMRGEVCSTAIATALDRAGIPNELNPTTGPINDLLPRSVIEEFERLRRTELGRRQLAEQGRAR